MVFSSIPFLFVFFPIAMILYYAMPSIKAKNLVLMVVSLIFYAWGEPIYIVLMVFSSVVDYCNGRMIEKFDGRPNLQKIFLILSVIVNLSLLGFFKYGNFIIENVNALFGSQVIKPLGLTLPIGISFYTFQTMSYSIDVYFKNVKAERNFFNFMTYVCMFPQLIAGPIVRYETVAEELENRVINFEVFSEGLLRFMRGLFKKVLIANSIGQLWNTISGTAFVELNAATAWLGIIAYAFQIFFDFAGYSDMAIGMGKMFGFNYLENFNYPYTAKSITDFWRRWHMSLSTWFRDYVYIPLGGNRGGKAKHIRNIMIVWGLTGLWHGSAWNFLLWGLYFGLILLAEKFLLGKFLAKLPSFFQHLYAIILILIGWLIFAFDDVGRLWEYAKVMFFANGAFGKDTLYYLANYGILLLVSVFFSMPIAKALSEKVQLMENGVAKKTLNVVLFVLYVALFVISVMYLVDDAFNPFLYFRF